MRGAISKTTLNNRTYSNLKNIDNIILFIVFIKFR